MRLVLIRQNILTWPFGIAYAAVSVVVLESLGYWNVALHAYYLGVNAYGWYYWVRNAGPRDEPLEVRTTPRRFYPWLALVVLVVGLCGWLTTERLGASHGYVDVGTTAFSVIAMWMTARKYIENWFIWLVVDVVYVVQFTVADDNAPYAVLYLVYLGMAVWGYLAWRKSLTGLPSSA